MRITFLLLFLLNSFAFGQRADFFKEDVTFRLNGPYFNVEGYYWFSNHSNKTVNSEIYYPFPTYSGDQIDSIRIYNITIGREINFNMEGNYGISFLLHLEPSDTTLFQIKYRQIIEADSAVYILKTTQGWGKPLDSAEFKLITPDSFPIKKFAYPPDKLYEIDKLKIYYWKRENFMPVQNMIFYF